MSNWPLRKRLNSIKEDKKTSVTSSETTIKDLREKVRNTSCSNKTLQEAVDEKENEIKLLKEQLRKVRKEQVSSSKEKEEKIEKLQESVETLKKDSMIKKSEYENKLSKERALTEKYRNTAKRAVDKYIALQALKLGLTSEEIKNKLSENFSFNDIDRVCEDLQKYKVNMSKLPFSTRSNVKSIGMKITESKEPMIPAKVYDVDDTVDESLMSLAGMYN